MGSNFCCTYSKAEESKLETLNHGLSSKRVQNEEFEEMTIKEIAIPMKMDSIVSPKVLPDPELVIVDKRISLSKAQVTWKGEEKLLVSLKKENLSSLTDFLAFLEKCKGLNKGFFCVPEEIWEESNKVHIITDLPEGCSLFESLLKSENFSEKTAALYVDKILNVLENNEKVFDYLNPDEVYFDDDLNVKIIPFIQPSLFFSSPATKNQDNKSQSWTIGVLLFVLLCGKSPFREDPLDSNFRPVFSFSNKHWDSLSKSAKNLIMKLLSINADKRPSLADLSRDEWITSKLNEKSNNKLKKELTVFLEKQYLSLSKADLRCYFQEYYNAVDENRRIREIDFSCIDNGEGNKEVIRVEKKVVLSQLLLNYMNLVGADCTLTPDLATEILNEFGYSIEGDLIESEISVNDFTEMILNLLDS